MKLFFFILGIYILALQTMPCADIYEKNLLQQKHFIELLSLDSDHSHASDNDLCSPFCICNCCGVISGFILEDGAVPIPKIYSLLSLSLTGYMSKFSPNYFGEIWQPPQIHI